jgi:hypothetical protein
MAARVAVGVDLGNHSAKVACIGRSGTQVRLIFSRREAENGCLDFKDGFVYLKYIVIPVTIFTPPKVVAKRHA